MNPQRLPETPPRRPEPPLRPPAAGDPVQAWPGLVLLGAVLLRSILFYRGQPAFPVVSLLLALLSILWLLEPPLSARFGRFPLLYFPFQTAILLALSRQEPFLDFIQVLYIGLSLQVLRRGAARISAWLAFFALSLNLSLILAAGWLEGPAFSLLLMAACAFLISYLRLTARMQADREESERMLAELQQAHQLLQDHAGRAEELAAVRERNRLARDLHDSVSQSILAIRLTSQTARLLAEREPARVPDLLGQLQEISAATLAQLRSLIAELRPPPAD